MPTFQERAKKIKLFATDVDGVLTDAGMYYSNLGDELKKFNTRDGMGIRLLQEAGIITAIITTECLELVKRRGVKLGINEVHLGAKNKIEVLKSILPKYNVTLEETAYIGDDLNDLSILREVGLAVTVADGMKQNKAIAHYITERKGGEGAVREIAELIIEAQGKTPRIPDFSF